ncbi:MAG: hypothetical protein ABFR05_09560 [Bacteroidota bacterium]
MKYLFSLLLVTAMSLGAFAQNPGVNMMKGMKDFTPDQMATLQTKRLTIALDLSDSQRKQILELNKKRAVDRKKNMEKMMSMRGEFRNMTSDERFKLMNDRLDMQIAVQADMKRILNDKQFDEWRKMHMHGKGMMYDRSKMRRTSGKQGKSGGQGKPNRSKM